MKKLTCKKTKNTVAFLWQEVVTARHKKGMSVADFRAKVKADINRLEREKRLATSGRKQQAVHVGRYSFTTPSRTNNLNTDKVDFSILLPEKTCKHCGKAFCLPYGHKFENYIYKDREKGSPKYCYFCSWSCLSKWRKEHKVVKEWVTKDD